MVETQAGQTALWPLAVYFGAVLLLAAFMLVSSHLLGQRHMERGTGQPYESGITPTGSAWIHFDVKYYLIAMFFVIFDVESIFVYAWAVALKEAGWPGFAAMATFMGLILAALAYLWRMGALDWAVFRPTGRGGQGS
ncbi:MAG: NADH-quinone oxidoreductase subunit A [Syntrophorhabdales bacterium]